MLTQRCELWGIQVSIDILNFELLLKWNKLALFFNINVKRLNIITFCEAINL